MHLKQRKKKIAAFTLIEVVLVIVIVGILLGITIGIGDAYVKTMRVKSDKEYFSSVFDTAMAIARTSNYYKGEKYVSIDVEVVPLGINSLLDSSTEIKTHEFNYAELTFDGSVTNFTVTALPYEIPYNEEGCVIEQFESGVGTVVTGVDFRMVSTINDDEFCYTIQSDNCKLLLDPCP